MKAKLFFGICLLTALAAGAWSLYSQPSADASKQNIGEHAARVPAAEPSKAMEKAVPPEAEKSSVEIAADAKPVTFDDGRGGTVYADPVQEIHAIAEREGQSVNEYEDAEMTPELKRLDEVTRGARHAQAQSDN